MKISIVTISYNQGQYLEEAINSVLNQRGVELEYIIVDPGSKDGSRDIINKYRNKLSHVIFEPDKGPADGLNKGFSFATGDVYGYLNSDDILMPGTLKKVADFFTNNQTIDVVSSHGYVIDEFSIIRHKVFSNKLGAGRLKLKQFCAGISVIIQPSTFFKKEIFNKTGGFADRNDIVWDAGLAINFMKNGARFKVIDDYWSGFRIYAESLTGSDFFNDPGVFEKLQSYAGLKKIKTLHKAYFKMLKWIYEPHIFIKRLSDGLYKSKRLI